MLPCSIILAQFLLAIWAKAPFCMSVFALAIGKAAVFLLLLHPKVGRTGTLGPGWTGAPSSKAMEENLLTLLFDMGYTIEALPEKKALCMEMMEVSRLTNSTWA